MYINIKEIKKKKNNTIFFPSLLQRKRVCIKCLESGYFSDCREQAVNPGESAGTQPQPARWRGALQSLYLSRRPAQRCLGSASVAPSTSSPPASASATGAAQVSRRAPQLLPLLVVVPLHLLLLPLLLRL